MGNDYTTREQIWKIHNIVLALGNDHTKFVVDMENDYRTCIRYGK